MLQAIIAIITAVAVFSLWIIYMQRKLVSLDENVNNAMIQIGVQLSSLFDVLSVLADLAKDCEECRNDTVADAAESKISKITGKSAPDDVHRQEEVISEALARIAMISERYPEINEDKNFIRAMDAVRTLESMMRTSRLLYNNSVTKLNREMRMFPTSVIAWKLGLKQREYLN
jgi:LemA protein